MLKKHFAVLCIAIFLLSGTHGFAGQCPKTFMKAMQQEGLEQDLILNICERLSRLSSAEKPEITADKIEKDITGKMVAGWIFQESEWRDIDILHSKYSGDKAKLEINVDTIRNKSGTLRLRYKWTGTRWKLMRIFNVDFD
ncbi:MAG: hypothetical protein GY697_26985 [Desulfobacterales bacterium]|nr:hypothetical protein [Desulfobacterales bacterium]